MPDALETAGEVVDEKRACPTGEVVLNGDEDRLNRRGGVEDVLADGQHHQEEGVEGQ